MNNESALAKIKTRCEINDKGCWLWMGPVDKDGYGISTRRYIDDKEVKRTHRITFWLAHGFLPRLLDHIVCDTPRCCNPEHTEPSTDEKNTLRGSGPTAANAKKTSCPKGHPYSGTKVVKGKTWRVCNTCRNEKYREKASQCERWSGEYLGRELEKRK